MAEMDYVRILRDLREDADKTQTQIAEILGTSQTMYARYERGANELPIHHLITLSRYYGVSTDICWVSAKNAKHGQDHSCPCPFCPAAQTTQRGRKNSVPFASYVFDPGSPQGSSGFSADSTVKSPLL